MRRALLLLGALVALAIPATADAKFQHGHYVGKDKCSFDGTDCPGFTLFVATKKKLRGFEASANCETHPNNGEDEGVHAIGVTGRSVKVKANGRFDTGVVKHHFATSTETFRARGRIKGRTARGTIAVTHHSSDMNDFTCDSHGVKFVARYAKHPYYRTGRYKGKTQCFDAPSDCVAQQEPISFRVKRGRIVNVKSSFVCQNYNDETTDTRDFSFPSLRIDWAGRFSADRTIDGVSGPAELALDGRVVGTKTAGLPGDSFAGLSYDETHDAGDPNASDDCHAGAIVFKAKRVGP